MQGVENAATKGSNRLCATEMPTARQLWRRSTIKRSDWLVPIPGRANQELREVVKQIVKEKKDISALTWSQFELSQCRVMMNEVKERLDNGPGFAVIDKLPTNGMEKGTAKALSWLLASMVARPVEQNTKGLKLYDVLDTGKGHGNGVRGDSTNVNLNFHTDNCYNEALPEYLALLCLAKGMKGGLSKSISFYTVHEELANRSPAALRRLYERFFFDRQREHEVGATPFIKEPVFKRTASGGLCTRFSIHLIRWGHDLAQVPIDKETELALETLLDVLDQQELQVEFLLEPGQIEFTNNYWCGHSRTQFVDPPEPRNKRHMVRYWLRDAGGPSYSGA